MLSSTDLACENLSIRGVNVDAVVRTLCARELIEEVNLLRGSFVWDDQVFLERMGMNSLDELAPWPLPSAGRAGRT